MKTVRLFFLEAKNGIFAIEANKGFEVLGATVAMKGQAMVPAIMAVVPDVSFEKEIRYFITTQFDTSTPISGEYVASVMVVNQFTGQPVTFHIFNHPAPNPLLQ